MHGTQKAARAAPRRATTLSDKLAASDGRPSGFDYMRLGLACAVFLVHCVLLPITHRDIESATSSWLIRPPLAAIVPMFFALSGFLVAGSLERSKTMVNFLGLRVLRIVPALSTEIVLSAVVLGAAFTTLPLSEYFLSRDFQHYFMNIVGDIHFYLPGVFNRNPFTAKVNGQLWTIPFEFECYAALALLAIFSLTKSRRIFVAASTALFVLWQLRVLHGAHWHVVSFADGTHVSGHNLVFAFLAAVGLYMFRDRVPWSPAVGALSAMVAWALLCSPVAENLSCVPLAYLTIYLGLMSPRRIWVVALADLSYGIYLFGTPIQQAIIAAAPWARDWRLVLALAGPPTLAVAWLSWTFIERPALAQRTALRPLEQRWLSIRDPIFAAVHMHARSFIERMPMTARLQSRRPSA